MMAVHGTLGEFTSEKEDWKSYVERLKQYFTAKDMTLPRMRSNELFSSAPAVLLRTA